MQIGSVNRVRLGQFPTPLQELGNLARALHGPRIFIKRDDLDGLGTGGNKLRKLEYAFADARRQRATAVITTGAVQSNHVQLTAAAANRLGLKTYLILRGEKPDQATGNLFLDKLLGVEEITYLSDASDVGDDVRAARLDEAVRQLAAELRSRGETPYYIPNGCSGLHSALGYSGCVYEIVGQLHARNLAPDYIVTACGTAGTQTGLILGSILYSHGEINVIGMSVAQARSKVADKVARNLDEAAEFLGLRLDHDDVRDAITVYDDYIGPGYGTPTPAMQEAVKLVAQTEGIILDPVYTGKAMAGLIDLIRAGFFTPDDIVVFLHTGGIGGLFAPAQMAALQE